MTHPLRAAVTFLLVFLAAPETTLTSTPTQEPSAAFAFTSETGTLFECSLDGAAFSDCTSPVSYSGLPEGPHTFQVRARDAEGNVDDSPAAFSWNVDLTAPDTTLTSTPADLSNETDATFTFSSEDTGATFECSLDGAAYTACTVPAFFDTLAGGVHVFLVRARDAAGNVDDAPASFSWTIDLTALETSITSAPTDPSRRTSATFSFASNKDGASFECALDGSDFDVCTSPVTYEDLAEGPHVFRVRAFDPAGNMDDSPASHSWEVRLPHLDTTLSSAPTAQSTSAEASFSFSGTEGTTFECSLDGAAFAACTSPTTYANLAEGPHAFRVRARDADGNVDATPAAHVWTIDTTPDTPQEPQEPDAPSGGCGCGAGPGEASWLLAGLGVLAGVAFPRRGRFHRQRGGP